VETAGNHLVPDQQNMDFFNLDSTKAAWPACVPVRGCTVMQKNRSTRSTFLGTSLIATCNM